MIYGKVQASKIRGYGRPFLGDSLVGKELKLLRESGLYPGAVSLAPPSLDSHADIHNG